MLHQTNLSKQIRAKYTQNLNKKRRILMVITTASIGTTKSRQVLDQINTLSELLDTLEKAVQSLEEDLSIILCVVPLDTDDTTHTQKPHLVPLADVLQDQNTKIRYITKKVEQIQQGLQV